MSSRRYTNTTSLIPSPPQIDIKKLARLTGYTEGSASVTIGKIKRKLKLHAAGTGEADAGTASIATPKKAAGAKAQKSAGKRKTDVVDDENTPSKKKMKKMTMMKGADSKPAASAFQEDEEEYKYKIKIKAEQDEDEDDGDSLAGYGGYEEYHADRVL